MTAWFDDLKAYVGFGPADEAALRALHAAIAPRYPEIVDRFYAVIEAHEGARAAITGGAAQIERLKGTLRAWLAAGLGGPHDDAWLEARLRIGRRHVAVGLPSRYMFTAINVIRMGIRHATEDAYGRDHPVLLATCDAVDKLLDLELAVMMKTYEEEAIRRSLEVERAALAERLASIQRLSAGLAHEVRNPLNAARLQLELLGRRLKRAGAEPGLLDVTGLVDAELRRLTTLLQEFLDFAQPAHLATGEADLVAIARDVLDEAAAAADARGIELRLDGDPEVVIEADGAKLHQVLEQLVRNGIEAARRRVVVDLRAVPAGAVVRVVDDGDGIPEEVRGRIFDPFFSTKETGTGMGLAIAYSLVGLHGGEIAVAGDGGAEITVRLPRHPPHRSIADLPA